MKNILLILLFSISNFAFTQSITQIDSVSNVMCDYLENMVVKNDTIKINTLYEKLQLYVGNFEQAKMQKIEQQLFYRFQRNCVKFLELLDRLNPPKEAVTRTTEKPKPQISKNQLSEFKRQESFYYFELAGDTTLVSMKKGKWKDLFSNKTYSELTYNWISNNEFELVFIHSNNESRSNFSVEGDKYIYQVLSMEDNHYLMSVNIPGQKTFEKFKMYFK